MHIYNGDHLLEVPLGLFEVIDNVVSCEWKLNIINSGEITLWPDLFYKEGFLENFAEREPEERALFEVLLYRIEKNV